MGENVKVAEQTSADRLREQIRHTEGDITETVHTLEERLSPRYLRRKGVRNAKRLAWQGTARFLELAQRTSVQLSVLGAGAGAVWMLLSKKSARRKLAARKVPETETRTAAKLGASLLLMLLQKRLARRRAPAGRPAVTGLGLALTAAKAFWGGARGAKKTGTTRPDRKEAWRGLATAIGAALGSNWYRRRAHRV